MDKTLSTLVGSLILGLAGGIAGSLLIQSPVSQVNPIAAYYENSAATLVSPHHLRGKMEKGEIDDHYVLVDLRTKEEYEDEHIAHAINIDSNQASTKVLAEFRELMETVGGKKVVIYCYSAACMNGRKVGHMLAQNGIYVHEMTVGWNEWRYDWAMWNYPNELDYAKVEDYIVSGPEPGIATPQLPEDYMGGCKIEGELSC